MEEDLAAGLGCHLNLKVCTLTLKQQKQNIQLSLNFFFPTTVYKDLQLTVYLNCPGVSKP